MAAPAILSFAELLRRYRRDRGFTQEALAEMAGLSARGIRALEQGERTAPHSDTVQLLINALQLSPRDRGVFETAARQKPSALAATGHHMPPIGSFLGARPSGRLIAREGELSQSLHHVEEVERGEGRLIMLAGEPGVGKTRLAQEIMLQLDERRFLVVTARCYEPEQAVPYYPFVEVLSAIYEAAPATLRSEVSHRWPYVEWLLPGRPCITNPGELAGQDVQQRLFWAIAAFLGAMAEIQPLALLIDDLQWADESSLKLFQHVARRSRAARIFLLGTYRDIDIDRRHPLERLLRELHREGLLTEWVIPRLPMDGTAALITAMCGEQKVSEAFIVLLHGLTDGNPFFTQEVVRAVLERGDLSLATGVWTRDATAKIGVPRSVRSAIGERLSRLSEPAHRVLEEASVLGQTFAVSDRAAMQRRDDQQMDDALDEALMASLIGAAGNGQFSFNHALTQQTLYDEIPARRRRRVHLSIAELLERLPDAARQRRLADLVWHFLQAEEGARALPYAMLAGDGAEVVFAHTEALQHYRSALALARTIDHKVLEAEAREKVGGVLVFETQYDEALDLLEQAAAAYRALDDYEGEARTTEQIGNVLYRKGQATEEGVRIRTVLERLENVSGPPSFQRALAHLYWALAVPTSFPTADYTAILAISARIAELGEAHDDSRAKAHASHLRGWCLSYVGSPHEARRLLEYAMGLYESTGDTFQRSHVIGNIGRTYLHEGDVERARTHLQESVELIEEMADQVELAWTLVYVGDVAYVTGDWTEARRCYDRSVSLARASAPRYYSHALLHRAELSLRQGATEQAQEDIQQGAAVATQCSEVAAMRKAGQLLAELDLAAGNAASALTRLQPLLDGAEGETPHAFPPPVLGETYLATGDEFKADALATKQIERFRRQHRHRSLPHWLCVRGKIRVQQQRWDEAEQAYNEAVLLARTIPYRHAEAMALYEFGILHAKRGEVALARERLGGAQVIFRQLAAWPDTERTQRALSHVP